MIDEEHQQATDTEEKQDDERERTALVQASLARWRCRRCVSVRF